MALVPVFRRQPRLKAQGEKQLDACLSEVHVGA